jgi:hypothetical protein
MKWITATIIFSIYMVCFFTSCTEDEKIIQTTTFPPNVTIAFPLDGSTVSEVVTITCMATGSKPIQNVSLWVDGLAVPGAIDTDEPFELQWNTVGYIDSTSHTIIARALDESGNQMDSDPIKLIVDNTTARPTQIELRLIRYVNNTFQVKWPTSSDGDFNSYSLYQALSSNLSDEVIIYTSSTKTDTSYVVNGVTQGEYRYYRLVVEDTLGLQTSSTMQTAGAFEVLFSDEFDTPASLANWQIDRGTWTIENGQLVGRRYDSNWPRDSYIYAGDITWTDYEVSFTAYFDNGDAIVMLRSTGGNWEQEYRVQVFPWDWMGSGDPYRNRVAIDKFFQGQGTMLLDIISPTVSNPAQIRARIQGSHISVYVNNRLVAEWTDSDPFINGRFGLGVVWELQSRFDNVIVWKL